MLFGALVLRESFLSVATLELPHYLKRRFYLFVFHDDWAGVVSKTSTGGIFRMQRLSGFLNSNSNSLHTFPQKRGVGFWKIETQNLNT